MLRTPRGSTRSRRARGGGRDRGFAVVFLALGLVVLLGATTVAVDLGSRYADAARIQRAADAAALAGVTMLPNGFSAAAAEARQVAARNGYTNGEGGVTVDVTQPAIGGQVAADSLQVHIRDGSLERYFGSFFEGADHVTRVATAKYVSAVSLGSPRNFVGTGDLLGNDRDGGDMKQLVGLSRGATAALRENFWLAVNGACSSRENGDRFTALTMANYGNPTNPRGPNERGTPFHCSGFSTQSNPEHRPDGYIYAVSVPPAYRSGVLDIQLYDPASCNRSRPGDTASGGMDTTFTVRTGSLDPLGGEVLASREFQPAAHHCDDWVDLVTVDPPSAGATYFIQVQVSEHANDGLRTNGFAVRTDVPSRRTSGRFWGCSSDPADPTLYSSECPQTYAVGDMGVFAALNGTTAEFFLAEIGPEHNGKELEITLFDPGEGAEALRIKDPNDQEATFSWRVDCSGGVTPPTGGCEGGATTVLDLIGNTIPSCFDGPDVDTDGRNGADRCASNPQPGPRRLSRWKYNDRSLTLTVQLPEDIEAAYGGATWWKVEYTTNTSPTDRTTWSVGVMGDPVRLVPNT